MPELWRISNSLLWVYYASIAALLLVLTARITQVKRRGPQVLPGLSLGDPVPHFTAEDLHGDAYGIPTAGRPTLVLFVHPSCATCYEIIPKVNRFHHDFASDVEVIIVTAASREWAERFEKEAHPTPPVVVDAGLIAAAYRVNVSPTAVLVGTDSRVARSTKAASLSVPQLLSWLQQPNPA